MVFDDREGESVGDDIDVFIRDVGFAITGQVAEEVHWLIEMGDCVGLIADEVVEAVGAVGVDEAVADPLACAYGFVDVRHDFKGSFDAVFVSLTGLEGFDVVLAGEAKDVEGFFTGKDEEFARLRPVYLWMCQSCSARGQLEDLHSLGQLLSSAPAPQSPSQRDRYLPGP